MNNSLLVTQIIEKINKLDKLEKIILPTVVKELNYAKNSLLEAGKIINIEYKNYEKFKNELNKTKKKLILERKLNFKLILIIYLKNFWLFSVCMYVYYKLKIN